jgi:hypothetical protein
MQNSRVPGGGRVSGRGLLDRLAAARVVVGARVAIRKKLRNEPNHSAGNPGESEVSAVRTNPAKQ